MAPETPSAWPTFSIAPGGAPITEYVVLEPGETVVGLGALDTDGPGLALGTEQGWETMAAALAKAVSDLKARELRGRADPSITAHGHAKRE